MENPENTKKGMSREGKKSIRKKTKETQIDVMPQEVKDIEAITFGTTKSEGEIAPQSDEIIEMAPSEENL